MKRTGVFVWWMSALAFVLSPVLLLCAEESGESIVIPARMNIPAEFQALTPLPRIELLVDNPVSGVSAACPLDASVIITLDAPNNLRYTGSGTVIASSPDESTVLTCAHLFRGVPFPAPVVWHDGKRSIAQVVKIDDANDVAIVSINEKLPSVGLCSVKPGVGDKVTSIGIKDGDNQSLEERSHTVTAVDKYSNARNFETDGRQIVGRSGGGLFFNGQLCGIIQGRRNDISRSIYVSIEPIRALVERQAVGSAGQVDVTLWVAPFRCHPCDRLVRVLGTGNERVRIVNHWIAPKDWVPEEGGFPFVEWVDSHGTRQMRHGIDSMERLEKNIADVEATYSQPVAAADVGASIAGRAVIESVLSKMISVAGEGSTAKLRWVRTGAKDALMIGQKYSRTDIVGTSGRIELSVETKHHVPIQAVKFDYRFASGRLFLKLDEIECEIPEEGVVGAAQPVGSPILLAWTIFSTIETIYQLFHPTVDVWLGPELNASVALNQKSLTVDCGPKPPAVRLHWAFWFGFLKFEYSRPLTGLIVSPESVSIQFHKSRIYRDVAIPVN